ncbi:MAG: DsrE/DsrF/DrsH-like family protein [Candidatus Cloacimonadales bacterium]|nr:DsrE/DsrF/DrsH-like family protein [Candidatus Cloacimonadales bacterium]
MDMQEQIITLQKEVENLKCQCTEDRLTMIVFSGELDKIIAAFIIATGAASMGTKVSMFFTFWGSATLRAPQKKAKGKNLIGKMFGMMLPKGFKHLKLSNMNMAGIGAVMIKDIMKKKKVPSLDEMLEIAEELEVQISICEMSMDLMGMKREEMIDYKFLRYCGVATFLNDALKSKSTLFI